MVWSIRQSAAELSAADAKQAEYYRQLLSGLRAEAETALARKYIELQQVQDFAPLTRVSDVRQMIRALESEIASLEQLGNGLRWL